MIVSSFVPKSVLSKKEKVIDDLVMYAKSNINYRIFSNAINKEETRSCGLYIL